MKTSRHSQILTNCPKCGNVVYVPCGVSAQTIVRCPLCKSQYSVESVLPQDIEELEIVGSESHTENKEKEPFLSEASFAESAPKTEATKFEVPAILKQGAKRRSSRRQVSEDADSNGSMNSGFEVPAIRETSGKPIKRPHSSIRKSRSRSHRRSSFSEGNRSLEIFKVVLGAALALPVAQLIIWWGLGIDPLGLGPSVGRAFPALVPKTLKAEESLDFVNGLDIRSTE